MFAHRVDACVKRVTLLESRPDRPVQAVLEIKFPVPGHDVGEEVAEVCGILIEEMIEIQGCLSCDQLIEADLAGRDPGPRALSEPMIGIRSSRIHSFEDH